MVAYLNKTPEGLILTLCEKPCNGEEFNNSEKVPVLDKREARAVCKGVGAKPYNF